MAALEVDAPPHLTLLAALRVATRPVHLQLEQRLDLAGAHGTIPHYIGFLRALLAVVDGCDAAIRAELGDARVSWRPPSPSRSDRLRHDLACLGASGIVEPALGLPVIDSPAQAFGAEYVLQGSQLGGAVIARCLAARGFDVSCMTYLRMHGDGLATAWRDFTDTLDTFGRGRSEIWPPAIGAAIATFHAVDAALTREALFE